jgi:ABC-type bacteriocin/lantibiotic exporter with double-glycine peptidase domain
MPTISLAVPHCKQEWNKSCVAACTRMVLLFHGRDVPEADLRVLLKTDAEGSKPSSLTALASLGFDVTFVQATLGDLEAALSAGSPPIVFVYTGLLGYWPVTCDHAAVVVGLDDDFVYLNDPYFDTAPQKVERREFLAAWSFYESWAAILKPVP